MVLDSYVSNKSSPQQTTKLFQYRFKSNWIFDLKTWAYGRHNSLQKKMSLLKNIHEYIKIKKYRWRAAHVNVPLEKGE